MLSGSKDFREIVVELPPLRVQHREECVVPEALRAFLWRYSGALFVGTPRGQMA